MSPDGVLASFKIVKGPVRILAYPHRNHRALPPRFDEDLPDGAGNSPS